MTTSKPLHADFLGTWILMPETCDYQQGDPPRSGRYEIDEDEGELVFTIAWEDQEGNAEKASFRSVPDGSRRPFAGGELADELSVTAISPRELNSAAFYKGEERMVAQRQLDDTKNAMRVTQVVRFPDGESLANIAIYRRWLPS